MKFKLSLLTITLFSLPSFAATTVADEQAFNTLDKVATSKTSTIEGMANKISEKFKLFGQGQIQANAARAEYNELSRIRKEVNDIIHDGTQPTNNCEKLRNGTKANNFSSMTRAETQFNSQNSAKNAYLNEENAELKAYQDNVKRFCNMQQQADGLCYFANGSSNLVDGDMNVSVLFGADGEDTRPSEQDVAMEATIQHLTGEDYLLPPYKTTAGSDQSGMYVKNVELENIPMTAKQFENLRMRHSAIIGLVSDGLYSSGNSHSYMPVDITNYSNDYVTTRSVDEQYSDPLANQRPSGNENNDSTFIYGSAPLDPKSRPSMMAQYALAKARIITPSAAAQFNASAQNKNKPRLVAGPKSETQSIGYCASYVSNAIIDGGKFNYMRPSDAYLAGPRLESIGFKKIPLNSQPQEGDILVLDKHGVGNSGGARSGHIQIYTGVKNSAWVSDFIQRNERVFNVPNDIYARPSVRKELYRHQSVLNQSTSQ